MCNIICGQDYKNVLDATGEFPIYGTGGIMGYASDYRCPANSIIIGRKGNINNPLFVEVPFWNVDTAFGVVPDNSLLVPKFFFYFCRSYDFTRHDVSVTIPSLRRTDIMLIDIPVPPLPVQQRIVAELDLLSGIVEKEKKRLETLDELAQSIFHEMFGDPVRNEMGWETDVFKKLFLLQSGDGLSAKNFVAGDIPVYGGNGISGYHNTSNKEGDYIIIGRVGVYCGNIRRVQGKFWLTDNAFELFYDSSLFNPLFLTHLLRILNLNQYANKAAQPVISNLVLKNLVIPLPPLPLQQRFAKQVEAIEGMKAKVRQSIEVTKTLLSSRMDAYFNEQGGDCSL